MVEKIQQITQNTLFPLSLIIGMLGGAFYMGTLAHRVQVLEDTKATYVTQADFRYVADTVKELRDAFMQWDFIKN